MSETRTINTNVINMYRPRDGSQPDVEAATRHSADSEVAADKTLFSTRLPTTLQLGVFRINALRSFPTCVAQIPAGM